MDSKDILGLRQWAIERAIEHEPSNNLANILKDAAVYEAFVRGGAPVKEDAPGD